MHSSSKQGIFPWFPLFSGVIGLALRSWLFSLATPQGLLPHNHISAILTFLLLAITLGVCLLGVRKGAPTGAYAQLFPRSPVAAAGIVIGAIGMGYSGFTLNTTGILGIFLPVLGVLSAAALLLAAYCRYKGLRPNCLAHCIVVVFLLLRILGCCQTWGSEPQLLLYFFHLLACLFLLIASYYRTEMDVQTKDCRRYVFFGQAALFCCCLCLLGEDWVFYLSAAIWMATDFCVMPTVSPEA